MGRAGTASPPTCKSRASQNPAPLPCTHVRFTRWRCSWGLCPREPLLKRGGGLERERAEADAPATGMPGSAAGLWCEHTWQEQDGLHLINSRQECRPSFSRAHKSARTQALYCFEPRQFERKVKVNRELRIKPPGRNGTTPAGSPKALSRDKPGRLCKPRKPYDPESPQGFL